MSLLSNFMAEYGSRPCPLSSPNRTVTTITILTTRALQSTRSLHTQFHSSRTSPVPPNQRLPLLHHTYARDWNAICSMSRQLNAKTICGRYGLLCVRFPPKLPVHWRQPFLHHTCRCRRPFCVHPQELVTIVFASPRGVVFPRHSLPASNGSKAITLCRAGLGSSIENLTPRSAVLRLLLVIYCSPANT
ncbi:hypothetical protein BDZ89DRAFT_247485 [Hymenopellis radicata]|nr:hypothetical protein BDZ89DRAFT_247485 [Hymenopellis radicata]